MIDTVVRIVSPDANSPNRATIGGILNTLTP